MKKLWSKKVLPAVSLLLLLPFIFIAWLSATENGLQFIYRYATNYLPGKISIGKLGGSLVTSIRAEKIQYKVNDITLKAEVLSLAWRPAALLSNKVDIRELHLQSLVVKLSGTVKNTEKDQPSLQTELADIYVPWRISLQKVVVDDFKLGLSEKTEEDFILKQVKLDATASLYKQVNIKSLMFITDNAEAHIKGKINPDKNFQHKLSTRWRTNQFANASIEGNGKVEGNLNTLKITQKITGPVQATFKADIQDLLEKLNWQAEASIHTNNPAGKWPGWPGQLKGKLVSKGQTKNGELFANIEVPQIAGTLRGYPLSLKSDIALDKAGIVLNQFQLRTGKTIATATGRLKKKSAINWSISSPNLAEIYPEATGQLYAKGKLSGTPSSPKLTSSFNAKTVDVPGYKIGSIKGEVSLDLFHWQHVNVELAAQSLNIKDFDLKSIDITADNNKLQVKTKTELATAELVFNGKLNASGLQGSLDKADLVSPHFVDWKLKAPATLKLGKNLFLVEPLCWQSLEGKACVTLQKNNETWQSQLEFEKLPLLLLGNWLPVDIKAEGVTNLNANFIFNEPNKLQGQAKITLPPGSVSYPGLENKRDHLDYRGGTMDVTLDDKGLNAIAEITISNENFIKGQLSLPAINLFAIHRHKQALQASARFNINDLTLIEAIIPETQKVKGEIGVNFSISGTLAKPKLVGSAHLKNASLQVPRLGLNINQLSLKSQSDGLEKLDFQLAAQSGQGHILIQGETILNRVDGWPTTLNVKGEKFEASHIPVSHLLVSPVLKIKLQKRTINVSGTVHIPYAKFHPKDVTTAAKVSDDTQIIDGEQVFEEKWLVHTKVRLTLGERVHFSGFGFDGRFAGSLLLQDEPGQLTKAVGEINIPEGRYTAYGQNLQVEHGRLLYTNGPVTNPGLDLRAIRQVDTITAGLKVRGTLNKPSIELFSIPAMGQTDTLAYLLLGRPIENATGKDGEMMAKAALALSLVGGDSLARKLGARFGLDEMRIESSDSGEQASLIIGRYLSPKLYVGYGVGLIESFNTFNVRYQISEKWQLKGESGENQGADLFYTIER